MSEGLPVPVVQTAGATRMLIAGVGYRNLRDMSLGPVVIDGLQKADWPPGVELEDLSYGPIGVMHSLDERPPYDRVIFVAGVSRNRQPGGVYCYRWPHERPDPEEVQARIAEAVTGVISLDNLLMILAYFEKLPQDVLIIEVEAADAGWGEGFTAPIEAVIPQVIAEIRKQVGDYENRGGGQRWFRKDNHCRNPGAAAGASGARRCAGD